MKIYISLKENTIWLSALILKLVATFFHLWYYQKIGMGDLLFYKNIWHRMYENNYWFYADFPQLTNQPRVVFFITLSYPFYIFSRGNLWSMGAMMSLVSFLGAYWAFQILKPIFPKSKYALFIGFFVWPTVVFWTSGAGKEVFVSAFLYPMVALVLKNKLNLFESLFVAIGFVVLVFLKYYYAAFFATSALSLFIVSRFNISPIYAFLLMFLFGLFFSFLHPNLHPNKILEAICVNNLKIVEKSPSHLHLIWFYDLNPDLVSFLFNAPLILFQSLFGPFWGESLPMKILAIVSWVQIPLCMMALINFRYFNKFYLVFFLVYCLGLVLILGFSAPNYGTLSRYKVATDPFWISGLIYYSFCFKRSKA